jgi:hypothetical protein
MKQIPQTENPLILRTDFSNQAAWQKICAEIQEPVGIFGFRAYVEFLDDAEYAGTTTEQLTELMPANYSQTFIFIADEITISHPEHPLLVLDLFEDSRNKFRVIPSQIQGIENNLSIGNMDFEEFAEAVEEDGIFRGFPKL